MSTKVLVKDVLIGNEKVQLFLQDQSRIAEWNQKTFNHLWFLVSQCPLLSDSAYIHAFAEISNFFWKGTEFQCIPSISAYQQHYNERIELERQHSADVFEYRLTDYKIFDVSIMEEPQIEGEQLFYFVCCVQNGLPYRVVCPFPYSLDSTIVHYQILPVLDINPVED